MIDIHMHIGRLYMGEKPLTPSHLLRFMDSNGIQQAALLPIESPEETHYYVTTDYVINVCRRHPDRFIPFCNVDPRRGNSDTSTDFIAILREYKARGCKGFGEAMSGLDIDDPRLQKIYEACGELGLPIILHIDALRNIDKAGLPRFERMLSEFPETIFVGHGPHFWAEISANIKKEQADIYPKGRVEKEGAAVRLLSRHANLYGDLSAGSGFNAITRDPAFGFRFLERFQDKLLLGTDICHFNQDVPIIPYFRRLLAEERISETAYDKITRQNATRILELER